MQLYKSTNRFGQSIAKGIGKKVVILAIVLGAAGLLYSAYNTSYIEVEVSNSAGGDIEFLLEQQKDDVKADISVTKQTTFKRRVPRGTFMVTTRQGETSHFSVVSTGGFFATTRVNAELTAEGSREFIGNLPKDCLSYSGISVISWQCSGKVGSAILHMPATNTTPSFGKVISVKNEAVVSSIFALRNGQQYLLSRVVGEGTSGYIYTLTPIDSATGTLSEESSRKLTNVSSSKEYAAMPYKDGFLLYSSDGTDLLFYKTVLDEPEKIKSVGSDAKDLELHDVTIDGEKIVSLYSQSIETSVPGNFLKRVDAVSSSKFDEEADEGKNTGHEKVTDKSIIVITEGESSLRLEIDYAARQAELCGDTYLCVVSNTDLLVFDISDGKPKLHQSMTGVKQIDTTDDAVLVVTDIGLLRLDTKNMSGSYVYTFAAYGFCGLQHNRIYEILCVRDGASTRVLRINIAQANTDSIDKLLYSLNDKDFIKSISPYQNLIYIVPDAGEPVFNPSTGFFDYDRVRLGIINTRIKEAVKNAGINTGRYQVINTLE